MTDQFELADGVHQLALMPGLNCWVLTDDDGATPVDTGLRRPGLVPALARLGIAPSDVTRILLTHGHPDHTGGIEVLQRAGAAPEIRIGEEELDILHGTADQPRSDPATLGGRLFNRVPKAGPMGVPIVHPEATAVRPGEIFPIAGGIEAVATPGHTPGHLAYRLAAHDLVIGGDVVFNLFRLRPSPAFLCWRVAPNQASVRRLADLTPATLALAHGRPVVGDVAGRLRQLDADLG